jgi:6-phosphogluconolactonase (cycloisomerase 2 family)
MFGWQIRPARVLVMTGLAAAAVVAGPTLSASASTTTQADDHGHGGRHHAVFVQKNDPSGNQIAVYDRAQDGALTAAGSYPTGGLGGSAVGAPLDALASEGSLTYDAQHDLLFAVNAGSDSLTVFGVRGDRLDKRQVVPTAGDFPVSVAVSGDLVYVLNAGGDGSVQGYRILFDRLWPIHNSNRDLGLGNTTPPTFISAPAQVGFSRDGRDLVVSTKNHNDLDVFVVRPNGSLAPSAVVTTSAGAVPFGFTFDERNRLIVTEAGASTLSSYKLTFDGQLKVVTAALPDGQAALCWITEARGTFYVSNAGSASVSAYTADGHGNLTLVGIAASTDAGSIDSTTTPDQRFLYVQASVAGAVDGFRVNNDGSLTEVTTVTGLPAFSNGVGMEGIAAD